MKPISLTTPLLAALTATGLVAQTTVVSPRVFTNIEGTSGNTHPLGPTLTTSPSMRYMSIHDDMQGSPGAIRAMAMRLNTGSTGVATTITTEVLLSTSVNPAATASTTFDNNHGTDKVTVVPASSVLNFPAVAPGSPGPNPFVYAIPFTTPFVYTGTGPLAWEMKIASRTNATSFSLDTGSGQSVFNLSGSNFGTGCMATAQTSLPTASSTYSSGTGNVTLSAATLAINAGGALILGVSTTTWLGLPLPLQIPGTAGGTSGVCTVYNDYVIGLPITTNANGAASVALPLTLGGNTLGAAIYHYGLTLDAAANPFGMVTSNARKTSFGDGLTFGGRRIFAFNNVNAATGTADSITVVTQFTY